MQILRTGTQHPGPVRSLGGLQNAELTAPASAASQPPQILWGILRRRERRIEGGRFPFRTASSDDEFVPWTISTALIYCSEPWVIHRNWDARGKLWMVWAASQTSLLKSWLLSMEIYVLPFSLPTSYLPKRISFWKHTNRLNRVGDRVCSLSTVLPFILMIQKFTLLEKDTFKWWGFR